MSLPVTRPITTLIHEPVYKPLQSLAATVCNGSMSELIRLLLYKQLLEVGAINQTLLDTLDDRTTNTEIEPASANTEVS